MAIHAYDADYFERGIETGKSCYSNYRWMPELTIPMAMAFIDYLGIKKEHTTLDYGCAKGFVVRALRMLSRQAYGCDISDYAINSSDNNTRKYLKISNEERIVPFDMQFDFILSKDVFEHIPESQIDVVLKALYNSGKNLLAVIPLGKDDKYIISAYGLDVTHVLAKDASWWMDRFSKAGWDINEFSYNIPGIKDNWANFEDGNGFFWLNKTRHLEVWV